MVTDCQIREQVVNILPTDESRWNFDLPVILYRHGNQILFRFLLLREREIITIYFITQQKRPVLSSHQTIHRVRIVPDRVQRSNERSHTCPCNIIYRNPGFLQHLQHSNMCHAFRTPTTQHQPNLFPLTLNIQYNK